MTAALADESYGAPWPAASLPRLLPRLGEEGSLDAHLARHGRVPYRGGPGLLLASLDDAGLTGRGGAGFPTGRKWRAVAAGRRPAHVVANAAEGEPASAKDRTLLVLNPHLVLDGVQLAAEAVGAREATVHAHPAVAPYVEAAVASRPGDRVPVRVSVAADRFLSGEESAVVDALDGGPGLPRSTPPRVFERGLGGRPTLVQNVETLAHVALLARYGAGWFRAVGTLAEPGSLLVSRHDVEGRPGVLEVAHGTPISRLVDLGRAQAVLLGGYHGTWVPAALAGALTLSRASLRAVDASPGAGVVLALPRGGCGLVETSRALTYLATESAGQCGPCLSGLPRMALVMEALADGAAHGRDLADLQRWAGLVERRGACHHPDGTVRLVRSALTTFADEVAVHLRGRCTATDATPVLPVPGSLR